MRKFFTGRIMLFRALVGFIALGIIYNAATFKIQAQRPLGGGGGGATYASLIVGCQ